MDLTHALASLTTDSAVIAQINALANSAADAAVNEREAQQLERFKAQLAERDVMLATERQIRAQRDAQLRTNDLKIQSLVMELAHLRRMRFGAKSESMALRTDDLFEESIEADVSALGAEIDAVAAASPSAPANAIDQATTAKPARTHAGRQTLPAHLPRIQHRHDTNTDGKPLSECGCTICGALLSLIGEDISEQLDVTPASFIVHQHIRPQYACRRCETVVAAPVPAAVIDGGMAAPGLISWVLTSKFADHLPLYRLEQIAARSNVPLARSTLADWVGRYGFALQPLVDRMRDLLKQSSVLHADETPVQQLSPGSGKTHRAYLWAYCTGALVDNAVDSKIGGQIGIEVKDGVESENKTSPPIVVFDYQTGRGGAHARGFLDGWGGHLMVDDYVGYKALFAAHSSNHATLNSAPQVERAIAPIIELGCMAPRAT